MTRTPRLLALAALGGAQAQDYPNRQVKIIVPFGAGGPADIYARQLAQHLSESMKQSFVVENVTGGGGAIGLPRFIALRGVLAWGAPMYLMVYLVPALLKSQPISPESLIAYAGLWATAGAVFGAVMWWNGQSNYRKLKDRRLR